MSESAQAGDVLAGRYRLDDLLDESRGGRFWRAHDTVLHRTVGVRLIPADDVRAERVLQAARGLGPLSDRRILRVLDADTTGGTCYVVLEWGQGESLDALLTREGPFPPRQAASLVADVAGCIAGAHDLDLTHGRLVPENVLVDEHGDVRLIGFAIDAALLGLPPGRRSNDVADLAALLYATLTGRWPGASRSSLPDAPEENGAVLRPRRVRAGIPRVLDTLCDDVLDPAAPGRSSRSSRPVDTARDVAAALTEFVGDATGVRPGLGALVVAPSTAAPLAAAPIAAPLADPAAADAIAAAQVPPPATSPAAPADARPSPSPPDDATRRAVPAVERRAPTPTPVPAPTSAPASAPASAPTSAPADVPTEVPADRPPDVPTQAGIPVFRDDETDVEWLRARSEKAAPPPPLEDVPAKPLFAPDPPEGQPVRRPRPGSKAADPSQYWPWDSSSAGHTGAGSDTGAGTGSATWPPGWSAASPTGPDGPDGTDDDDHVPGRSWFRLAMTVAVVALVLVAGVAAYQLGLGRPGDDPTPSRGTDRESPTTAAPTPYPDLVADDFDPQGSPPRDENAELVPAAVDGDPATSWRTVDYEQDLGPGGLKTGVGLVLDLGGTRGVREVVVTTVGGDTSLSAYVTSERLTGVADRTPVGDASGTGELTISLEEATTGRYVTVWLTSLPAVEGGFRGTIAEVQVLG